MEKLENEEKSLEQELASRKWTGNKLFIVHYRKLNIWRSISIFNRVHSSHCYWISVDLPNVLSLQNKKLPRVETGIPVEAFDLECPDSNLKALVLQEFILIDDRYSDKLEEIENNHSSALGYKFTILCVL